MKNTLILAAITALLTGPLFAQSAQDGEKIFKKCKACHQVGEGAKNKIGPILTDVIGRPAGSVGGFKYSKSMFEANAAGLVWTSETIFEYLQDPTKYLRALLDDPKARAKMTLKLKKSEDRRAVIAYLASFSTAAAEVPQDGFCIVNASDKSHFFVTETREGARQLSELAPSERLCAQGTAASDGIVSVYEDLDGLEGCSRIIPTGTAEEMLVYAEFDRCGWSSHKS
ncbi:MAG: cytochrome c family protein [Marinosulfonomonas sp.]|nr:cytochrome c family protein [Marinosulfonomonas sp.]